MVATGLVRTGGRGWLLLPCHTCTHGDCVHDIRVCVCVCVYNLSERDWHAIEINRCGCVMATISNIRGGGYCEIDCTCFFSPLPFFLFFSSSSFVRLQRALSVCTEKIRVKGKKQVLDAFAEGQAPSEPDNEALFDLYVRSPVCTLNYFFGHSRCALLP